MNDFVRVGIFITFVVLALSATIAAGDFFGWFR